METENLFVVCGSIVKTESLLQLTNHILENSCVLEANMPYSNYYGQVPRERKPNSIFIATKRFYWLDEVLRLAQKAGFCYTVKANTASAILHFGGKQYPAIRIKNFPDYKHIVNLQECLIQQNVQMASKLPIEPYAVVKINKPFVMEKVDDDIYLDKFEKNNGYITLDNIINKDVFSKLMEEIRNNSSCKFFDAARGSFIMGTKVQDMIRIYSEKIDLTALQCFKKLIKEKMPRAVGQVKINTQ